MLIKKNRHLTGNDKKILAPLIFGFPRKLQRSVSPQNLVEVCEDVLLTDSENIDYQEQRALSRHLPNTIK